MNKYQFKTKTPSGLGNVYYYCYADDRFETYLNIKNINKDRIRETIGMSLKDAYKYLLGKFNKTKFEIFYEKFTIHENKFSINDTSHQRSKT